GTILDPDTDLLTLHQRFGNSWKVEKSGWLFSVQPIRDEIEKEIETGSPFTPIYDTTFESPEQEQKAAQVCKNDTACMLDVSLTGDVRIGQAYVVLEEEVEAAVLTNELFAEAEKTILKDIFPTDTNDEVATTTIQTADITSQETTTTGPDHTTKNIDDSSELSSEIIAVIVVSTIVVIVMTILIILALYFCRKTSYGHKAEIAYNADSPVAMHHTETGFNN
ncbi:uncharacterized protein LOC142355818, partial [Convolutriloba macropyga]|uniref:uncharacterized protein LOC142355818 n=1 Tax=Convolutriloba macropyga TaxID=536237 RepID=UPI003F51D714